jgi:hypothetical protein
MKHIYVKITTFVTKRLQYKLEYYFITTCKKRKYLYYVLLITELNCCSNVPMYNNLYRQIKFNLYRQIKLRYFYAFPLCSICRICQMYLYYVEDNLLFPETNIQNFKNDVRFFSTR